MNELATILTPIVGILLTLLLGQAISKLGGIESHLEKLNGHFFEHVTAGPIHEAGFARVEEKIKALTRVVELEHQRLDAIKGRG